MRAPTAAELEESYRLDAPGGLEADLNDPQDDGGGCARCCAAIFLLALSSAVCFGIGAKIAERILLP